MKKLLIIAGLVIFINHSILAQTPYISYPDGKHPEVTILDGIISKYALQNIPAFNWYQSNQQIYQPAANTVNAMEAARGKVQFVLFGGTWCEDTQFILPRFFKLQEQSGFPDEGISFFAADRSKKTIGNIATAFQIINVPTIIVMKEGKEVGRVVEYGKTGNWEKELVELLTQ